MFSKSTSDWSRTSFICTSVPIFWKHYVQTMKQSKIQSFHSDVNVIISAFKIKNRILNCTVHTNFVYMIHTNGLYPGSHYMVPFKKFLFRKWFMCDFICSNKLCQSTVTGVGENTACCFSAYFSILYYYFWASKYGTKIRKTFVCGDMSTNELLTLKPLWDCAAKNV